MNDKTRAQQLLSTTIGKLSANQDTTSLKKSNEVVCLLTPELTDVT